MGRNRRARGGPAAGRGRRRPQGLGGGADVGEDGGHDGGIGDGGEHLHAAGTAGADEEVLAKHTAQELGPRHARGRRWLCAVGARFATWVRGGGGGGAWAAGHEGGDASAELRVGGEHPVIPGLVLAGRWDQRREAAQERDRREHQLGLPGEPRPAQAVGDLARRGQAQAAVRERRPRAIAREALEAVAIVRADRGVGVQREVVDVGGEPRGRWRRRHHRERQRAHR